MNVLVMGAGGVGGYFGALLARLGHSVTVIARGPHLDAMQRSGLRAVLQGGRRSGAVASLCGDARPDGGSGRSVS